MAYLGMLWLPLGQLTGFSAAVAGGVASLKRVLEVLDAHTPVADVPSAVAMPTQPRIVEFRNVSMA